jgi:ATP-dependent DNA helicase RecQ
MLVRVITLRFDAVIGSFDDGPLREFLKDKEVLSIRDHFFVKNEVPYLTVLVTYYPHRPEATTPAMLRNQQPDGASWRTLVTEAELPLFNTLRDWRAERSKRDGVPPYVICTNRQFAAMVKTRPQSLSKLAEVEGFGKAKLEKYGEEILALLARVAPPLQAPAIRPEGPETGDDRAQS